MNNIHRLKHSYLSFYTNRTTIIYLNTIKNTNTAATIMTITRNIIDPTTAPIATTAELKLEPVEVLVSVRENLKIFHFKI